MTWTGKMIDEVVTELGPCGSVTRVQSQCGGHILVYTPTRQGGPQRDIVFADLGSVLSLWTGQGGDFTPDLADQLADALHAWAESKRPTKPEPVEGYGYSDMPLAPWDWDPDSQ